MSSRSTWGPPVAACARARWRPRPQHSSVSIWRWNFESDGPSVCRISDIYSEHLFRTSVQVSGFPFLGGFRHPKPSQTLPKCPWRPRRSCVLRWCRTVFMTPSYEGLKSLFRTSVPNIRCWKAVCSMFLALVEVFGDFRRQIRIQHVELYHIDPWKHRKNSKSSQ